jgi:flagellar biosynthesis protein FlhB
MLIIITRRYKWDTPILEQVQPKLLQLTPIEAARQIYKIKEIYNMLLSMFQVPTNSCP